MALSVGTTAPDFTLLDTNKQPVSLSTYAGQPVVLVFFPAAFTGVCEAELCAFRDSMTRLNAANAQVLAISADLPFANGGFAKANGFTFPLLSDWKLETIHAYDIPFTGFAGIEGLVRSERAVFIVDGSGVIRYVEVTANPGVEPNYDALLSALEQL